MRELDIDDRIKLLTGDGMWHTKKLDGIPQIQVADGPHGLRKQVNGFKSNNDSVKATCFPTASSVASSFNRETVKLMASSIAKESKNENVSVLLGPGINIKRSPLCGRNFEYYSEDPYLTGALASTFVSSVEEVGVGTSVKHFCLNNQETKRMISNSMADDKALREIYLKAFEMVIRNSNPASVMASYNKIDGLYSTENKRLLTDILRNEWHYDGVVISDWGACSDLVKAVKAGMDLEMPDSCGLHYKKIKKALKNNSISIEDIKKTSTRILNLIDKYKPNDIKYDTSKNHENAVKVALDSAVLLKNNGILPLKTKDVVVVGALAKNVRFQGGGSSHINTTLIDAVEALENVGLNVKYYKGYHDDNDSIDNSLIDEVLENINKDSIILFFGGLPDYAEGEGYDRRSYQMPENELHLLSKIRKVNNNIVFISFSGTPYDMSYEADVEAILQMYLAGEGTTEAIAKLVTGEVSPSGRLAETYPFKLTDTPSYSEFATNKLDVMYKESIFIGYRYYDTFDIPVRYPFGYGLSYSKFTYSDIELSKSKYIDGKLEVSFKVKNVGSFNASTAILLFVENPSSCFIREKQGLKGFTKVYLEACEERKCVITLDEDAFNIYEKNKGFIIPSGKYKIKLCGAINEVFLSKEIDVEGIDYENDDLIKFPKYFDKVNKLKNITDEEFLKLYDKPYLKNEFKKGSFDVTTPLEVLAKNSLIAKIILNFGIKECRKMVPNKPDTDPELMMMLEALKEGTFDSVCCHSEGIIGPRLEEAIILSANGKKIKAIMKLICG